MEVRYSLKYFKELVVLLGIFIFVLAVNYLIIEISPIFFEQPPIYLANQKIHSFWDLIKIYFHPEMLYRGSIPYFRPSGHFLMYQILTPFLGWHNIKGLIIVNFLCLSITGYFMVKLYQLLFPKLWIGAYIGFVLFMIHPALVLSRMMVMQFDYNHALFITLAVYCFVLFCQKNNMLLKLQSNSLLREVPFKDINLRFLPLFIASMFFYAIAITFKEGAIAAVFAFLLYFFLNFGNKYPLLKRFKLFCSNKQAIQLLTLISIITVILALYMSMQWAKVPRDFRLDRVNNYFYYANVLLGAWKPCECSIFDGARCLLFSFYTLFVWWGLWITLIVTSYILFKYYTFDPIVSEYKKSIIFLVLTGIAFIALPLLCGGFPWHLMPALLFFSLALGFGFEYLCNYFLSKKWCYFIATVLILMLSIDTINLNKAHFNAKSLASMLMRNAILYPPNLQHQLNTESVLVVEESERFKNILLTNGDVSVEYKFLAQRENSYNIGSSFYPFEDLKTWSRATKGFFLKPEFIYSGTVFRWAYLMPNLKEEVYPFRVEAMQKVPDDIIYNWIQHHHNIYAVGYDEQANWHDITDIFKKYLYKEKIRRHFDVHLYTSLPKQMINGNELDAIQLPFPNPKICQLHCDKNPNCQGFVLMMLPLIDNLYICQFNGKNDQLHIKSCPLCVSYLKKSAA